MKICSGLSLRYIKNQTRRTIVIILGIVLAVALFTAVGTMLISLQHTELVKEVESSGYYHADYSGISLKDVNYLESNYEVDKVGVYGYIGRASLSKFDVEGQNDNIEVYDIGFADKEFLNIKNIKLYKGNYPKKTYEILVYKSFEEKGYKLGDRLKFYTAVGNSHALVQKEFIISGFMNTNYDNMIVSPNTALDIIAKNKVEYNAIVKYKEGSHLKDEFKEVEKNLHPTEKIYNNSLLILLGQSNDYGKYRDEIAIFAILSVVILAATSTVIYNAFNISILNRVKQFGILRACGASPSQIKGIVLREGLLMSIVGIPIGILSGIFSIEILLFLVSLNQFSVLKRINIYISYKVILAATLFGLLCILVSSFMPALGAGRISPMDAIKKPGYGENKLRKSRRHIFIKKLFKFEGVLAVKSMGRNKRRSALIIFSISISITLFMVFNTFLDFSTKVDSRGAFQKDILVYTEDVKFKASDIQAVSDIEGVKNIYPIENEYITMFYDKDKQSQEYKKFNRDLQYVNNYALNNNYIMGLSKSELDYSKSFLVKGSINKDKLDNGEEILVVEKVSCDNNKVVINEANFKVGDEIIIDNKGKYMTEYNQRNNAAYISTLRRVKVGGILQRNPIDYPYTEDMVIMSSNDGYKNLLSKEGFSNFQLELKGNADKQKVKADIKKIIGKNYKYYLEDFEENDKKNKQEAFEIKILFYGFAAVIALISILNIVNTIATNLILRVREFSTLRAVGMSIGALKRCILLEGIFYGVLGNLFGIGFGYVLSYKLYKSEVGLYNTNWYFPISNILLILFGVMLIIELVSLIFTRRIGDYNIVDSMRIEE